MELVSSDRATGSSTEIMKEPVITAQEIHDGQQPEYSSPLDSPAQQDPDWHPGFRQQFPWLGALCIFAVFLCANASVLILVFSNTKSKDDWKLVVAPNVLLSTINSVASIAITLAVGQGIAIAWWRKAMQGATVKELHHSWSFSVSLSAVLLKCKYFNAMALAALVTKFAIIDGILFQRSASTYQALGKMEKIELGAFSRVDFPVTGVIGADGNVGSTHSLGFAHDVSRWLSSVSGEINDTNSFWNCDGICYTDFTGIGFVVDCTNATTDVDLLPRNATTAENITLFDIDFVTEWPTAGKDYTWIRMDTSHFQANTNATTSESCPGTLMKQTCALRPAVIRYPVTTQAIAMLATRKDRVDEGVKVTLGSLDDDGIWHRPAPFHPTRSQVDGFTFVDYINIQEDRSPGNKTRVGGITLALQNFYKSSVKLSGHYKKWTQSTSGQWANTLESLSINRLGDRDDGSGSAQCPYSFDPPAANIIPGLNAFMFILSEDPFIDLSLDAQKQLKSHPPHVSSIRYQEKIFYQSNFMFMAGALASTLLCLLCILPSYWGFWKLGRPVSLGPFEIASAFRAPVLAGLESQNDQQVARVARVMGKQKVQYREIQEGNGKKYRFDLNNV